MVTAVGLPLLIVNGKFQSLGSMTVEDLETFIPFLVKCSVNRAGAQLINGIPEWWSSTIQFKFPLKKPNGLSQTGYRKHLYNIVCRCYWYHNAQYLLPFCARIARSPESVYLRNNEDNTTSIFYSDNTIHIMKFNNENKDYDMKSEKREKIQRRCLLSALPRKTTPIADIYLCENCDAEYFSLSGMLTHEKDCFKIIAEDENENEGDIDKDNHNNDNNDDAFHDIIDCDDTDEDCNAEDNPRKECEKNKENCNSTEEIEILEHIKPTDSLTLGKRNFFSYLQLNYNGSQGIYSVPKVRKSNVKSKSKGTLNSEICFYKNRNVEFSSLLGRKMHGSRFNQDLKNKLFKTVLYNESYCSTNVRSSREQREHNSVLDFKVTYKKVKIENWVHQYCFSKKERRSKCVTLKTGLNENSRKLLKQCKRLRIVLNRLNFNS